MRAFKWIGIGVGSLLLLLVVGLLLAVMFFDANAFRGRLRVRKAAVELTHVLEVLVKKSESGNQPSVFAEITDDDIDNLFND